MHPESAHGDEAEVAVSRSLGTKRGSAWTKWSSFSSAPERKVLTQKQPSTQTPGRRLLQERWLPNKPGTGGAVKWLFFSGFVHLASVVFFVSLCVSPPQGCSKQPLLFFFFSPLLHNYACLVAGSP